MALRTVRIVDIHPNRTASHKAAGPAKQAAQDQATEDGPGADPGDLPVFDCMERDGAVVVEEVAQAARLEALRDEAERRGDRNAAVRCRFRDDPA